MPKTSLVIFLHGVGSCGDDLIGLSRHWAQALPDTAFAAPDGPDPFDMHPHASGHQWFSVKGVTADNRFERIVAARPAFDTTLNRVMTEHGINDPARVALVGFSQGSIMAYDAVMSGRWPVAALVAYSGRFTPFAPLNPAPVPVLIVHGDRDTVIPVSEATTAAEALTAAGVRVETHILPGLEHGLNAAASRLGGDFLMTHLG